MSSSLTTLLNKLRIIKQVLLSNPAPEEQVSLFNCPVCGAINIKMHPLPMYYFVQWQKHQTVHNPFFIETMNMEHYMCSNCFASDRDRLYALYMQQYIDTAGSKINLLDIAPAPALRTFLKSKVKIAYRSMDLVMADADDKQDITNMDVYNNEQFDFFICSHVLEHIPDDVKAMEELYRILKRGGKGIAMVPLNLQLKETAEDPYCTDEALRWKYFFQNDHVRMYAKEDFVSRLTAAGFTVEQLDIHYFTKQVFEKNAIYPTSVLYVVSK